MAVRGCAVSFLIYNAKTMLPFPGVKSSYYLKGFKTLQKLAWVCGVSFFMRLNVDIRGALCQGMYLEI